MHWVILTSALIVKHTTSVWERELTNTPWNKHFSQEEEKVCHLIQHCHPTEETTHWRSPEAQRETVTTMKDRQTQKKLSEGQTIKRTDTKDLVLPYYVPHQEEESILSRGAEVLPIYRDLVRESIHDSNSLRKMFIRTAWSAVLEGMVSKVNVWKQEI